MNRFIYFTFLIIFILASSCSSDEPNGGEIQPDKNFPDPEETTTVSLYKNSDQKLDGIYIDVNDKFVSTNGWLFVSLGEMKGLGNITSIPKTGWSESASVKKGYGYIAYNPNRSSGFYRMFISNSAADEMGTITGFQVKYQKPFYGFDEAVTVDKSEFSFNSDGGEGIVNFTNNTIIPYKIEVDCDWIEVTSSTNSYDLNSVLGYALSFRVADTNSLNPSSGTIRIKTYFDKETTLTINRGAMTPWSATTTILDLKNKYWSKGLSSCHRITEDVIVRGYIVSSDKDENIFKCIVIEDETAALPISLNQYSLYLKFPIGQEVAVNLNGLCIGNYQGYQQIGEYYSGDANITFLPMEKFQEFSQYQIIGEPIEIRPITTTLSTLHKALYEPSDLAKWQGCYIKLDNISFREQGVSLAEYHTNTNRLIFDESNLQIAVRTSGYAHFMNEKTPKGVGSISGILSYYNGTWQLMLNSLSDIGAFDPNASISPVTPDPDPEPEPSSPNGDGSENNPYNVAAVLALNNPGTQAWVAGYIVGCVNGQTINDYSFSAPFEMATNFLIADTPDETKIDKCIPVQLPIGTVRPALNLRDNPNHIGKQIRLLGSLERYYARPGLKTVTSYSFY